MSPQVWGPDGKFVAGAQTPKALAERERRERVRREGLLRDQGPRFCQRPGCRHRVPAPGPKGGKPRKWCSRECARLVVAMDACPSCGGPKGKRARRCTHCVGDLLLEHRRPAMVERQARIEGLWADGLTLREIAEAMGWASLKTANGAIWELRRRGANLPYRRADLRAA